MFVRVKKIGAYEYLYLVENAGEGGRHVQRVVKALGRRDEAWNNTGLSISIVPVPVGYSNPNVPMVKPTQDREGEDASCALDVARNRSVLLQRLMRTTLVIIFLVRVEQMAQMLLAKDHHVIEAVPPDRSDQPLGESILSGRSSRNRAIPYVHRCEAPSESLAIGAIAVTNDITRRLIPAAGLG
jgi:hypothetical protein